MLASLASLLVVWAAVLAIAWRIPEAAAKGWRAWNRLATALVRRQALTMAAVIALPLLLRALLLPLWPVPDPVIHDEFSYLLQADTFAHGRLTNPTHPLAEFFESAQTMVRPSYASKYPPAQAAVLALGERFFGNPWVGVWLSCGVLAGCLWWALNGWFPPAWALFGVVLALPLCSVSYWMNSYMGGSVAAIGGALVAGAYPRLVKKSGLTRRGSAWVLAAGFLVLLFTRPYEGVLLLLPTLAFCLYARVSLGSWARIICAGLAGLAALAYYNHRVTGDALLLPYIAYQKQYQVTPQFNVQPLGPPKQFRNEYMRLSDEMWERVLWENSRRPRFLADRPLHWVATAAMFSGGVDSFLPMTSTHANVTERRPAFNSNNLVHVFLAGAIVLAPALLLCLALARGHRTRFAFALVVFSVGGSFLSTSFLPHYAAPALTPILILVVGAYRYLKQIWWRGKPVGQMLAFLIPAVALALSLLMGIPALLVQPPVPVVATRARLEESVLEKPGRHLIIVRYNGVLHPHEEWVYNGADLDGSRVVWAHDLGAAENRRLTTYFHDRVVWLFQPNIDPGWLEPYRE